MNIVQKIGDRTRLSPANSISAGTAIAAPLFMKISFDFSSTVLVKFISKALIIFWGLMGLTALAAPCDIEKPKTQAEFPEIYQRSTVINFPQGQSIQILAHYHGDRTTWEKTALQLGLIEDINDHLYFRKDKLDQFFLQQEIEGKLRHTRQDVAYVAHGLRNKNFEFVGFERRPTRDSEVQAFLTEAKYYEEYFGKLLASDGVTSKDILDKMIFSFLDSVVLTAFKYPDLLKPEQIVFAEDNEPWQAHSAWIKRDIAFRQKVDLQPMALQANLKQKLAQAKSYIQNVFYPSDDMNLNREPFQSLAMNDSTEPLFSEFLDLYEEKYLIMRNRDRAMAKNLAKQKKNGVMLMGNAHYENLSKFLSQECVKSMKE